MGGAWERLVGVVKRVLRGVLPLHSQDRALNPDVFCTVLAEVESVVNSRPLTKVSSDCTDLNAITPNHILLLLHFVFRKKIGIDNCGVRFSIMLVSFGEGFLENIFLCYNHVRNG